MSFVLMKMRLLAFWIPLFVILWLSALTFQAAPDRPAKPPKPPRKVRCRNILFPMCRNIYGVCPPDCPRSCLMDCATCKPVCNCNVGGAVCEDPRFVGGDGITFYFHGWKNQDFCLVSDANLHINAHFIGKRNPNLKRDFTWVQSLGIMFDNHKLLVAAKQTSTWDDMSDRLHISLDSRPISIPTTEGCNWNSPAAPSVKITRTSNANGVVVDVVNNFRVAAVVVPITREESKVHGYNITDEDCFAHLELGFKFYNLSDMVDGVLGQTYRPDYVSKTRVNVPMPVMGGAHKFSASGLFATDCMASKFGWKAHSRDGAAAALYPSMECTSGIKGSGVVCRK